MQIARKKSSIMWSQKSQLPFLFILNGGNVHPNKLKQINKKCPAQHYGIMLLKIVNERSTVGAFVYFLKLEWHYV